MRRAIHSSVRGAAAVAVMLALAGSAVAVPREDRTRGRDRGRTTIVEVVKRIVQALGDGLTIPKP
jgi:hypothetical protein